MTRTDRAPARARTWARPPRPSRGSRPVPRRHRRRRRVLIARCARGGGKLLICGNGGSAADAQHLATEFVSTLTLDHPRPSIPAHRAHHRHLVAHRDRERLRRREHVRAPGRVARSRGRRAARDLHERQLGERLRAAETARDRARVVGLTGRVGRRARAPRRRRDPRASTRPATSRSATSRSSSCSPSSSSARPATLTGLTPSGRVGRSSRSAARHHLDHRTPVR